MPISIGLIFYLSANVLLQTRACSCLPMSNMSRNNFRLRTQASSHSAALQRGAHFGFHGLETPAIPRLPSRGGDLCGLISLHFLAENSVGVGDIRRYVRARGLISISRDTWPPFSAVARVNAVKTRRAKGEYSEKREYYSIARSRRSYLAFVRWKSSLYTFLFIISIIQPVRGGRGLARN